MLKRKPRRNAKREAELAAAYARGHDIGLSTGTVKGRDATIEEMNNRGVAYALALNTKLQVIVRQVLEIIEKNSPTPRGSNG